MEVYLYETLAYAFLKDFPVFYSDYTIFFASTRLWYLMQKG